MNVVKSQIKTEGVIPLMATLPYLIEADQPEHESYAYDPISQLTVFAGRGYSTCREDESAGGIFQSKSDTKKDD